MHLHSKGLKVALDVGTGDLVVGNDRALCKYGIRIPFARNSRTAFNKSKYLASIFSEVIKPEIKLGGAELLIA